MTDLSLQLRARGTLLRSRRFAGSDVRREAGGLHLGGFWNLLDPQGQRLNVFPRQAGDEHPDQLLADLVGDFLFLAACEHEVVELLGVARRLDQLVGEADAFVCCLCVGIQQIRELVSFAKATMAS